MRFKDKREGNAYCKLINTAQFLVSEFEDYKKFKENPEQFIHRIWKLAIIEDFKRAIKTLRTYHDKEKDD
jgi:dsDNA-binding SOS-regulon protein